MLLAAHLGFPVGLEYTKRFLDAKLSCMYIFLTTWLSMAFMDFGDLFLGGPDPHLTKQTKAQTWHSLRITPVSKWHILVSHLDSHVPLPKTALQWEPWNRNFDQGFDQNRASSQGSGVVSKDPNSHKEVIQTVFPFWHMPHNDLCCFPELVLITHVWISLLKKKGTVVFSSGGISGAWVHSKKD